MEVSNQGADKPIGMNAFIISISIGVVAECLFRGKVHSVITTTNGGSIIMKSNAFSWEPE